MPISIPRIGFLGAGKMATALARGWVQAGLITPESVYASDPHAEARAHFSEATGSFCFAENSEVIRQSDVLVLAVKPQVVPGLLPEVRQKLEERHLIVSIVAGVTLTRLARELGEDRHIIRVMPNTPCLVGASASAYAASGNATPQEIGLIDHLLNRVGKAFAVPERMLDAVTGLSGSGPAYVFLIIEALSDGGVRMGLPRDIATQLAAQTVLGAAKLLLETGQHPGALKDMVASPGGTTIAGLHALEKGGLRAALIDAVQAATTRSVELGS